MRQRLFRDEADALREMLQARWRIGQEADAAERARILQIVRDVVAGRLGDAHTLRTLRETTALKSIIEPKRWTLETISHLEALIYGVRDAYVSFESPLWRGEAAPASMRLASADEVTYYCPDSTGVEAVQPAPKKHSDSFTLANGDKLVAQDEVSQGVLKFVRRYLQPDEDDPHAIVNFHRDGRIRDNYAERSEHALESAFTMNEIASDFAQLLLDARHAHDDHKKQLLYDKADEVLMEFNLQRYALYALLQTSHWSNRQSHNRDDQEFVRHLSRDLLMHALAEKSYELPTRNELRGLDYQETQDAHLTTVEDYFSDAYVHMECVLGIRPHQSRITEVPAVDMTLADKPQGWVH